MKWRKSDEQWGLPQSMNQSRKWVWSRTSNLCPSTLGPPICISLFIPWTENTHFSIPRTPRIPLFSHCMQRGPRSLGEHVVLSTAQSECEYSWFDQPSISPTYYSIWGSTTQITSSKWRECNGDIVSSWGSAEIFRDEYGVPTRQEKMLSDYFCSFLWKELFLHFVHGP